MGTRTGPGHGRQPGRRYRVGRRRDRRQPDRHRPRVAGGRRVRAGRRGLQERRHDPAERVGGESAAARAGPDHQGADRGRRGRCRQPGRLARDDRPEQAQGREDRSLDQGHGGRPRRRRGHRHRHPQDQGRAAGRHRRERLPPRQPGRHPPPGRHRRLHRQADPVHRAEDRRGPAEHRRQPPGADRGRAGQEEGPVAGRAPGGPAPQGRGQEHRRVRRLRGPRRHRRPAAHHRHELGPHQSSHRHRADRPGDRGADPAHRLREGEDRPGPEAEVGQPLGRGGEEVSRGQPASRARWST